MRKRSGNKETGRDTFHIVCEHDGVAFEVRETKHGAKVALLMAMGYAERTLSVDTLEVWRKTLLGPETLMYRVERDEHGVVRGHTIEEVD